MFAIRKIPTSRLSVRNNRKHRKTFRRPSERPPAPIRSLHFGEPTSANSQRMTNLTFTWNSERFRRLLADVRLRFKVYRRPRSHRAVPLAHRKRYPCNVLVPSNVSFAAYVLQCYCYAITNTAIISDNIATSNNSTEFRVYFYEYYKSMSFPAR